VSEVQVQLPETHVITRELGRALEVLPGPQDLVARVEFWSWLYYELRQMFQAAAAAEGEASVLLRPMRTGPFGSVGKQYLWEFEVNDAGKPRDPGALNWHGHNLSQSLYAGCILIQNGRVSTHH